MDTNFEVVNLLWTGGWDSTFRLLTLLLVNERTVQPYYIIDTERRSLRIEISTLRTIKHRLVHEYPAARGRFLPVVYKEVSDIPPHQGITNSYFRLRAAHPLGSQYEWLARFAHWQGLKNLELCITFRGGTPHTLLDSVVTPKNQGHDSFISVDAKYKGTDVYEIFKDFHFPLFETSKYDMLLFSRNNSFEDLMIRTWFCHRPLSNGNPCGVCNPCKGAMDHGFGWRLPPTSRARYFIRKLLDRTSDIVKNVAGYGARISH